MQQYPGWVHFIVHSTGKNHLMTEMEWRNLGVQQSPGLGILHGPLSRYDIDPKFLGYKQL